MTDPSTYVVAVDDTITSDIASALERRLAGEVRVVDPATLDAEFGSVDGIVIDAAALDDRLVDQLAAEGIPIVVLGTPDVTLDDTAAVADRGEPDVVDQVSQLARSLFEQTPPRDDRVAQLHTATTELVGAETEDELYELALSAATHILDFDASYLSIAEGDVFVPTAYSEQEDGLDLQVIPIDHGLTGRTYETGESYLVDDLVEHPHTEPVHGIMGSGLSVPIGEFGVFQAVSNQTHAYTESDLELAELLATYTAETLARLRSERTLRERDRELKRQNERLDSFTSVVSHDLRTPLSVAQGYLELAREEYDSDELDHVAEAHQRMSDLIENLLDLSRRGKQLGEISDVSLSAVAQHAWASTRTPAASIDITVDETVRADRDRLVQLFSNLFANAIEHGGDTVSVTVGGTETGFYVADDGPGIPETDRESVLEHGFTTNERGTGFGLAIVAEIVNAHGWTITVGESEAGGARFDIETG